MNQVKVKQLKTLEKNMMKILNTKLEVKLKIYPSKHVLNVVLKS